MMRWLDQCRRAKHRSAGGQAQIKPACRMKGGIALSAMSSITPVSDAASATIIAIEPSAIIILPLLDYYHQELTPMVIPGQTVTAGMPVASGILSTVDGTVTAIEGRAVAHASGRTAVCVVIEDHSLAEDDTNAALAIEEQHDSNKLSRQSITPNGSLTATSVSTSTRLTLGNIQAAAIHGLGGAGFSTVKKLSDFADKPIQTLIINAVECEPLLSCDVALMVSDAVRILDGIRLLVEMLACNHCVIAIEDNRIAAIQSMETALKKLQDKQGSFVANIKLQLIPPVYPSGAERMLVQIITGMDICPPNRPANQGVLCLNVATAHAAWLAANHQPMLTRVVTIAGPKAAQPCNVRVKFGTPIRHVLEQTGNLPTDTAVRIRVGGPFSGYNLLDTEAAITATCNCLTLDAASAHPTAEPCIRCGACNEVCPVELLPQQLLWHARAEDLAGLDQFNLDQCIKCGCCDWVCPSSIPLTDYFRFAQSVKQTREYRIAQAKLAEQRFQQRQARQTARKQKRKLDIDRRKAELRNRAAGKTTATPDHADQHPTTANGTKAPAGTATLADSTSAQSSSDIPPPADSISDTLARIKRQRSSQANNKK
ncbi:MAG: electron transport complex subunit RsxC [Granulosicoccus sp.]